MSEHTRKYCRGIRIYIRRRINELELPWNDRHAKLRVEQNSARRITVYYIFGSSGLFSPYIAVQGNQPVGGTECKWYVKSSDAHNTPHKNIGFSCSEKDLQEALNTVYRFGIDLPEKRRVEDKLDPDYIEIEANFDADKEGFEVDL